MIQAKIKSSIIIPSVKEDKILISLSTKHAAKPPSGPDPPFSVVWRSSPALDMISLSSFIYGCSSWWYLVCSPATSLPHQLRCKRWCNGGVVLCGEQNRPTSFRSFRSPVTSPYQLRSPSPGLLISVFPGWSYVSLFLGGFALWFWLGTVNWRFRYVEFGFVVLVTASFTLFCACVGFGKSSGCFND
ncbi:hypothetical protein F2Q69_00008668 [Brassica cretica]|uniref:Transmembrane protein n=1 Tax=Brassica cretica TaxID=69181 RepID=A0A8S9P2L1_BRACR|nr:hypothetical protein F2Q69_00008668 [Brassica cretica]